MATPQSVIYPQNYGIHDSLQMVWVLKGNSLTAVPFTSNVKPVRLDLVACRDTESHDAGKGNLVYLGIKGKNICLCCAEVEGQPTLQLEEKKIMEMYNNDKAQKPFLFICSVEGSTSVLESASYPGWFIASSKMVGQPIILTKERGKNYNTNFYLESED
ncbi:hypothetical protein MC885_000281 [Smutsia gigantea]|nr:hypothetical protein MC885_000281 [Smutsia gigantea]